ncbi:MAG: AsmA-like C-terminal domain-containing protein [Proteobacteria bacterium]|nr:AsmA-like C-terminal domain-containing protein [Pseudomonadota bacterium]
MNTAKAKFRRFWKRTDIRLRRTLRPWIARIAKSVRQLNIRAHHVRRGSLIAAGIATVFVFFIVGGVIRLFVGPISLGFFKDDLRHALTTALPGLGVKFDEAALEWSRDENRVNVVILGARVFDADQRIIAQAPKAEVDLAARSLLNGTPEIRRITLVGVQLTMVRTADGKLRLGIERDNEQGDVLQRIRDALAANKGESAFETFAVKRARLAFYDEATRLFIVSPNANLEISTGNEAGVAPGTVTANIDADIEISGRSAHLAGSVKMPPHNGPVKADISLDGLNLRALGENAASFASLKSFDLKTDITASFTVEHGTSLRYADFGLGAAGVVGGLGAPLHVSAMRVVGRYDGATGRLLIDEASLGGKQANVKLTGSGDVTFAADKALQKIALRLSGDRISFNMPEEIERSVTKASVDFEAAYTAADRKITIEKFTLTGGTLAAQLNGTVTLDPDRSPALDLQGRIAELSVRDLVNYWPLSLGEGPRDWIDKNISAGRMGPIEMRAQIPLGALSKPALPEEALLVTFAMRDATVTYIRGLTPMTNVQGAGTLTGDTFKATIASGTVNSLKLTDGAVDIPNLHSPDAIGEISGRVAGAVPDVLALADMPPLGYPSRFHIKPSDTSGAAVLDIAVKVPMLKDVNVDNVGISIKTNLTGLNIPLGKKIKIANGNTAIDIDNNRLHATGTAELNTAPITLDWTEDFKPVGPITSRIALKGMIDEEAREALNFRAADVLQGPVGVVVNIEGRRGKIQRAVMTMDLTPANVGLDIINFKKPSGVAATANLIAKFDDNGFIRSEDVDVSGGGIDAKGSATFDANGDLQNLQLPVVKAGALNDFSLSMSDTAASGLNVDVSGRSVDGTALGKRDAKGSSNTQQEPAKELNKPFHIMARLDRVVLRNNASFAPFAVDVSGIGDRPQSLAMTGSLSSTVKVSANITTTDAGRKIALTTNDAGLLISGLFGLSSIKGGTLDINVALPPMAQAVKKDANTPDYSGLVAMKNFKVINQPFLTRLFAAGSLDGLSSLMRGQGIVVDKLQVPLKSKDGVVTIRDARANGPSLGITAEGFIDRRANQIGLRGAIAPLYGINTVLGYIPLVGDVLVSKKGEGIIGMTYDVSGNADEPEVGMNPLSVLTPGILRRIFQGSMPKETQLPPPKATDLQPPAPTDPQPPQKKP